MTELGVFARVFPAGPAPAVARAIRGAGFTATQLNLSAVGRPTLDTGLTEDDAASIGTAFRDAGIRIWGVSGTFNAIHPDVEARRRGVDGCLAVVRRAGALGAEVVTLCTGTRDPANMWHAHPDNRSRAAWADLLRTLDPLLDAARTAGVRLGIEPEPGNVVADADTAARLFQHYGIDARHLAVVLDPANLLTVDTLPHQEAVLTEAFDVLGAHVAAVHAKDVVAAGYAASGCGGMDYPLVLRLHAGLPHPVPVIAQDLSAEDAPRVVRFLRDAERAAGSSR
ncbi:sugar phosphate isomerase/epimerase family protein [Nakamurella endophytica]|uniref:Epimerase n=1 Tax=Nakamurella endophytica TaxID=1748367 RepID=A0A917T7J8_9ACTN|nr:sugar phosphate isomerase/epimerase [Nakamurella endophytica]GGM10900.1 epimerase [Nakamurella endophytica]